MSLSENTGSAAPFAFYPLCRLSRLFGCAPTAVPAVRWLAMFLFAGVMSAGAAAGSAAKEVVLGDAEFRQLPAMEASSLAKVDKIFSQGKYREAWAEYDGFMAEYRDSVASAYALMRKGRCQMLDNRRGEAVMTFMEVVDYFSNSVEYAAAALFYQGQCLSENGEPKNAAKAWKKMVSDPEYRQHRLAAPALVSLANCLAKVGKAAEAAGYYEQAALDFRARDPEMATVATERAYHLYVRLVPNEEKLREFYDRVAGADGKPAEFDKIQDAYWDDVRAMVRKYDSFEGEKAKTERADYFKYWADQMESKRSEDNPFRIDWAWFRLQHEGNVPVWIERLDKQFAATYKPGDNAQIVEFIWAFGGTKEKVEEYYAKLKFPGMGNELIAHLIDALIGPCQRMDMARSACDRIDHSKWTDDDRLKFHARVARFDERLTLSVCKQMQDRGAGMLRLLQYYASDEYGPKPDKLDKALPIAADVVKVPRYESDGYWMQAGLLQSTNRYEEAIESYIKSNKEPESLFRLAECYVLMRKQEEALTQLTQIENYFKESAPRAALEIAHVYKAFGDMPGYVAALRKVMKKYRSAGRSSN